MSAEASDVGEYNVLSIPQGGPIYIPDMVSPLTRVPDFELSVFNELQDLKAELGWDSLESCEEDISVDELKLLKEEELVEKAFKESFKDEELIPQDPQGPEERPNQGETDKSNTSIGSENRESNGNTSDKKKKRRRANQKNSALEESCVAKVQQLARIKQKQDEDKEAARLHSFNGSCSIKECATSSSEKANRMKSLKSTSSSAKVRVSNACGHVPVHFPEVTLCFEVYHSRKPGVKTQEFLVLGRQFLTEVRDKIYCLTDDIMKKADQYEPSGYFLIEDVFCNDTRVASAEDYSKPILEWLENSENEALEKWECIVSGEMQQKHKAVLDNATGLQLPRFKSVDMQKTRFCDLRFRLGAGYIYCHQGDCKHLIVIRDMRLIHPEDVQNRAAYPLNTFQCKLRFRKCSVCKIYKANKVTIDDKWAAENPCYFCNICYYMLHYVNGSLLYNDFSVYDYYYE
ncbi:hypothetical protein M9H77_07688 [Catharanthus roseus]|uniref:Uncharacterized protein n=1 Tax=Catharanthus roseus TaxID=4058 RepID=A0ACC0BW18_CATRO|nr:hypothetical protein M9H77_07688 [Catharanthus roseus]